MNTETEHLLTPIEVRVARLAAGSTGERTVRRGTIGRGLQASLDRAIGRRGPRTLADPRLEALRNATVAVRDGRAAIPPDFIAAGFTVAHAIEIQRIVRSTRSRRVSSRRDRAAYATGITLAMSSMVAFVGLAAGMMVQP